MRIMVISFALHIICILNSNGLWAPCLPKSMSSASSVSICDYLLLSVPVSVPPRSHYDFQSHNLIYGIPKHTAKLVNMAKGC